MTYKIFFEDKKIILTNKLKKSYKKKYPIYTKEKISIPDFLKKIENHSSGKFKRRDYWMNLPLNSPK